jgi:AraC-like DNA-binding protein
MQKSIEEIIEHYNKNQIKKCDQLDAMLNEAILTGSIPVGSIFHYCGMNIPYRNIMIIAWRDKAASGTMFGKTKGVWYYYPSGKTYMIVSYKSDDMQALTYWLQSVSNVLDQTIAGSIPNCEFSLMYKQAEKMLEYDWIWDTNKVLIYQDEAKNQQVSDYIRRILKYTIAYDVKFVIEEIEKIRLAVSDAIFCRIISEVYKQKSKELLEMSSSYRIDILAENNTVQPKAGWKNSIYQILYEIKQIKKFKMSLSKNDPVKWAKEYVDSHIGNEIDMSVVANELNISYQYFSKIFREKENISFSEYVQEMRMKEACRLLLEGNKITVISEKTGYKNANNFAKAFKKMYGASPKSFRNELLI